MSLSVAINSAIAEELDEKGFKDTDYGEVAEATVCTALGETSLRREVFEVVRYEMDEVSIADVHQILDALVAILRGERSGD